MLSVKVSRRKHSNVTKINKLITLNKVTNSFNLNLSQINFRLKIIQVTTNVFN